MKQKNTNKLKKEQKKQKIKANDKLVKTVQWYNRPIEVTKIK